MMSDGYFSGEAAHEKRESVSTINAKQYGAFLGFSC